jgi:CheY-like chemotaxis protein
MPNHLLLLSFELLEEPGKGAKPSKDLAGRRRMMIPERGQSLVHCHILVVEDEYFIADDMAKVLERFGAKVIGPAPNQEKALALLFSAEKIDAAVLDINLRGSTVFPIADTLIEQGVPFVFATGYAPASVPAAYAGVPRWEKPFDLSDLAKALPHLCKDA